MGHYTRCGIINSVSEDRFQFLEFEESFPDGVISEGETAPAREERGGGLSSVPLRGADGMPLAQVVVTDPRGYGAMLRAVREEEAQTLPVARRAAGPRVVEIIGTQGRGVGQFSGPAGLAADSDGVLFVADSLNHRVQRITPEGGVTVLGGRGTGRGQFFLPQAVACDAVRAFYVVEQGGARVQKFGAGGTLELTFGKTGSGRGEMRGPTGIAVAPGTGDIYVADTGNGRVQRFDAEGRFLMSISTYGRTRTAFGTPQAVAVGADGGLWVADGRANTVVSFDPYGRALGQAASFHSPRAVCPAPQGGVYVADTVPPADSLDDETGRVRLWHRDGAVLEPLPVPRTLGLARPSGIAVSPSGDVYVSDALAHRILRWTGT